MNIHQNYTKLASIRPVVLSSSAYRHLGSAVFPEGRRTSVTLVTSPDHFAPVFKLGGKIPLFTAENNPDGTVKLTSTNIDFPSWLTIAGRELVRLTDKAGVDIDEPFMDLGEHLAFHYDPSDADELAELLSPTFASPTLADADLADFASASLGSFYTPTFAPATDEADELADFFCALPVTPEAKPAKELADADELAEELSPTKEEPAPSPQPHASRRRLSAKYKARITRKSSSYRGRFLTAAR